MKYKTTKKDIKNNYDTVLECIHINALLHFFDPFAYSTRAEGWACDYYMFDDIIICEGYAPIGEKISYKLQQQYNDKARAIYDNYNLSYEQKKGYAKKLITTFIKKALDEINKEANNDK